ncbi:glutathione S-transferase 1-1-like [Phymastichus coffea]|uniref:glutathione S-transferase 1-1-like n=1 Tax=Phymastichus coffea TaxID=108790 RepID=UPI00273BB689|nr:glutathione S-transferase 1-1-like [Phymastichus coffea]
MELYYAPYSPPSRAVRLIAEYIGLSPKLHYIDVMKGEHLRPEYEEINPEKKIPFLVDGDLRMGESRAIMVYLVEKYGKNAKILPNDPTGRAFVNLALHFDLGTLYKAITQYYFPVILKMEETHSPEKYEKLKECFDILDKMLESQDYVATRYLTIADLSLIVTVSTAEVLGFELDKYKNVSKWCEKVKVATPGYRKINAEGAELMKRKFYEFSGGK